MSAQPLSSSPDSALWIIINALRCAAEVYLRDAVNLRADNGSPRLVSQFLKQQSDALRLADELEAAGDMPLFLRRQAD